MDTNKRLPKYHEGWLENKAQDSERWANHWCVLRSNVLFFFLSTDTVEDTHVGTLTITSESRVTKLAGNETSGYQFDLYTRNRCNRFRTRKFYERELWKAYVEGISQGYVPDNIDLPPDQITQVRKMLGQNPVMLNSPSNESRHIPSDRTGFDSPNSSDSGFFNIARPIVREEEYVPPVDFIESDFKDSTTRKQMYRFCSEQAGNAVPSWFYFRCSREDAEEILTNGTKYGNTLMRVSSTDPHSLVISKRVESTRPASFIHYKVLEQSQGYSLDVTNEHSPMGTLSDVMDFFVKTAGKSTTVPMSSNDLKRVNHEYGNFIRTPIGAEETPAPTLTDCEEYYVGPPSIPAPPPPPLLKQVFSQGHTKRSMSVPMIPKTDLPQINQGNEMPPPLPPNHPSQRRGSGQLVFNPLDQHQRLETATRPPGKSLQGAIAAPPPLPSSAVPGFKSPGTKPQSSPLSASTPPQPHSPASRSATVKPPPIPSSPVPDLNASKSRKGGDALTTVLNQAMAQKSAASKSGRLEALLEKDRQKLSELSTSSSESEHTSQELPQSARQQTESNNVEASATEAKPERKVPTVASAQFLEILSRQISGGPRPAATPAPSGTNEPPPGDGDGPGMYENLDQYQKL